MHSAPRSLALQAHVLRTLTEEAMEGRTVNLDTLTDLVDAPRADIRTAVSELHVDGFVDALRMRVTSSGFVFGTYLGQQKLTPLAAFLPSHPRAALSAPLILRR